MILVVKRKRNSSIYNKAFLNPYCKGFECKGSPRMIKVCSDVSKYLFPLKTKNLNSQVDITIILMYSSISNIN